MTRKGKILVGLSGSLVLAFLFCLVTAHSVTLRADAKDEADAARSVMNTVQMGADTQKNIAETKKFDCGTTFTDVQIYKNLNYYSLDAAEQAVVDENWCYALAAQDTAYGVWLDAEGYYSEADNKEFLGDIAYALTNYVNAKSLFVDASYDYSASISRYTTAGTDYDSAASLATAIQAYISDHID